MDVYSSRSIRFDADRCLAVAEAVLLLDAGLTRVTDSSDPGDIVSPRTSGKNCRRRNAREILNLGLGYGVRISVRGVFSRDVGWPPIRFVAC
jgi:hypothetical protein